MNFLSFILVLPVILITIMIHEVSHGFVADKLGDPTPRRYGRLTLNPFSHLDIIGTLVLIITQRFGWAKPVPVNPYNFENPRRDMALVACAGPVSNFVFAYFLGFFLRNGFISQYSLTGIILVIAIQLNLGLAIFNLIPIPPLDGSRIIMGLLPEESAYKYAQFEQYGFVILLLILIMGGEILNLTLLPILQFLFRIFTGINLFSGTVEI
jgi:Zn-dependent protease